MSNEGPADEAYYRYQEECQSCKETPEMKLADAEARIKELEAEAITADAAYDDGYNEGYTAGYEAGLDEGYRDGVEETENANGED